MTSGTEVEQTDWSTSQSMEGHGSSYKEGAHKEKTREEKAEREEEK